MIALLLVMTALAAAASNSTFDYAKDQLILFSERVKSPIGIMHTSSGCPIEMRETMTSLNKPLTQNKYFMDHVLGFSRENYRDRVMHKKGVVAFGYFEVTKDITHICKASMFDGVGKKTPIAMRVSNTVSGKEEADTSRDRRGFAVKFYTEHGNFDLAGTNSPILFYKDPLFVVDFVRAFRRNPTTNMRDLNAAWDMLTARPESIYAFLYYFGDAALSDGVKHMPGFGIHTFQVVNERGEISFIRFHILPDAGVKNLLPEEASKIAAEDSDYYTRCMYNDIESGNYPSWTLNIQVVTPQQAEKLEYDVHDVTRIIPEKDFPLIPIGKLVLNRNPKNFYAENEQLAFNPGNLVPGILGAADKVFESRVMAYKEALMYRLGTNDNNIEVNCPIHRGFTYNRDSQAPVLDNGGDTPNYLPNSFNGPVPYNDWRDSVDMIPIHEKLPYNFDQAADYINTMTADEQTRLVSTIVSTLVDIDPRIQERAIKTLITIHPEIGNKIRVGVQGNGTATS